MINVTSHLESTDPAVRRKAIQALGRAANPISLAALEHIAINDPLPDLRALAGEAAAYIRSVQMHEQHMEALIEQHLSANGHGTPHNGNGQKHTIQTNDQAQLQGARLNTPTARRVVPVRRLQRRVLAWMIVLVAVGLIIAAWNWFVNSGMLGRYMTALGFEYTTYDVTTQRINDQTQFRLLVPPGEPPPDGYPVLVAIHGAGGDGRAMMALFAEPCRRAGVMLIAPTFPNEPGQEYYLYQPNDQRLNAILDVVWQQHRFDRRGVVLAGYSSGAVFATYFASDYGADLAGVVLIGLPPSSLTLPMPARGDLEFWLTAGDEDFIAVDASQEYTDRLYANGNPVYWETIPHTGFEFHPEQVDLVMDLVQTVYSR
jgi:predicted esterase